MMGTFEEGMEFARRLDSFRDHIEHEISRCRDYWDHDNSIWAPVCLALLNAVEAGLTGYEALKLAITAYERQRQQLEELRKADTERRESAYDEAKRKHDLAIQATCPYCGAQPGATCRSAGPTGLSNPKGIHDHVDRYRMACHLLKTTPAELVEDVITTGDRL